MIIRDSFRNTLALPAGDVANRIEWCLREAKDCPEPILHMNNDGLVIEYNSRATGSKIFEKICNLAPKSS